MFIDGQIIKGKIGVIDECEFGDLKERPIDKGDKIMSGSIVGSGEALCWVTENSDNSRMA